MTNTTPPCATCGQPMMPLSPWHDTEHHCQRCGTRRVSRAVPGAEPNPVVWHVPAWARSHAAMREALQENVDAMVCTCLFLPNIGERPPCLRCRAAAALALDTPEAPADG